MKSSGFEGNYKTSNCASKNRAFSSRGGFNLSKYMLFAFFVWGGVLLPANSAQSQVPPSKQKLDTKVAFIRPQVEIKTIKKLDTSLSMLAETYIVLGSAESKKIAQDMGWIFDGKMVEIVMEPIVKHKAESISKNSISAVGGVVTGQSKSLLRAKLPVARLVEAASSIEGIGLIRPPFRPKEYAVISEGVGLTGSTSWQASDYNGSGVKVAVIDSGFNGLSSAVSNGDIPPAYIARDETGTGLETGSDHGTAVSEAVCDMAPGVQLYCIKIKDDVDLENAKDYCIAEGIHIINHSMGWKGDSDLDGTGLICDIANDANTNGILWVNAAGNDALKHCQASFTSSGYPLSYTSIRPGATTKPLTNFPETAYGPVMYVSYMTAGTNLNCFLTWDAWTETGQDYDLFLYRNGVGWIVGSVRDQTAGATPVESISYTVPSTGWYAFGVTKYSASRNHRLNLFVDSENSYIEIDDALNRIFAGSCAEPAVSAHVLAVGAIDRNNWASGPQEQFSSQGPTNGGLTKPDISGPDNCNSYTYGYWTGTSQSSPHVAGAAALVKHAFPSYTNSQLRSFLENQAVDLGAAGKDNIYGYGKLNLGAVPPPPAVTVPNVVGISLPDANSAIIGAGLVVGTITQQCSDTVAAGYVISQNPVGGTTAPPGSSVDLVVSSGQPSVPDVTGMTEAAAIAAINAVANISYGTSSTACSDTLPAGSVISQSATGTVPCGTVVNLVISSGQPSVPDVTGMTEAAAIAAINAVANISYGTSSTACSDTLPAGSVISQSATGTVPCGTVVNLVISSGPCLRTISGYVTEPDANIPVEGVSIDADNGGGSDITDANGYYELTINYGWSGVVTPAKGGYTFEPNGDTYTNVTQDFNDVNYTAELMTFVISGYVLGLDYITPINDVNVSAENGGGQWTSRYGGSTCMTNANGYYEVVVDYNWSGPVTPIKYAYAFDEPNIVYTNVLADQNDQNYIGWPLIYAISGYIKNECNNVPIEGVSVDANNGGNSAVTDSNGFYEVWVSYAWSGTVTPSKKNYTFEQNQNPYVNILADKYDQNYVATNIYDLYCDGFIDLNDVKVMCVNWLMTGPDIAGDFNVDEFIDFIDFAVFAFVWQDK